MPLPHIRLDLPHIRLECLCHTQSLQRTFLSELYCSSWPHREAFAPRPFRVEVKLCYRLCFLFLIVGFAVSVKEANQKGKETGF